MSVFDVAMFGTSLTAGTGVDRTGLQPDLYAALQSGKTDKVKIYNFGIGGGYTTDGLALLSKALRLKPKAFTIEYTMNDCLLTVSKSQTDTLSMINQIKAACPASEIFLLILNPTRGTSSSATTRAALPTFNAMYRNLAVSESIGLIDTYAAWSPATLSDIPDGVHPMTDANRLYALPDITATLRPLVR